MDRIQRVIAQIEPHDSIERYTGLGVDVVKGYAKLVNPWTVSIAREDGTTQTLTAKSIVLATGAAPAVPPLPGLKEIGFLTSDTLWGLRELPARLVVLGGGPIGCELAQAFARLGSQVIVAEMLPRLMIKEDAEVSALARKRARKRRRAGLHRPQGAALRKGRRAQVHRARVRPGASSRVEFDVLICAVGRAARLKGYGLEDLGIPTERTIETNEYLETLYPNIYAAGDVAGPYQFTHVAAHQAWYAAVNGAVRQLQEVQGRLFGDPVGDLHRSRGGARRLERTGSEGKGHRLRSHEVRHRRSRSRDRRQRGARLRQGAHGAAARTRSSA